MKRYDLNLLAALDALLAETSVSAAARRLGLGQPAMSSALARLRVLLDDPLLVRTARGMEPTSRARELAGPLRETLVQLRRLIDPVGRFDPLTAARTFRISGGDYAGMTVLPALVSRLSRVAPHVDLRYRFVEKDNILALLDRDEIDFALCVMPVIPTRFASAALIEETFVCVVRVGHPLLAETLTPERFAAADHLLVTERGDERGRMDELLAAAGLSRRIMTTVPSAALVADILRHSDLIATIPRRAGERIATDASLRVLEPPFVSDSWTMSMVWPERNSLDPGVVWLREQLAEVANRSVGSFVRKEHSA